MNHIIIKNINDYQDKDFTNYYSIIKPIKKDKIDKLKYDKDKKLSILGEILLIDTLKKHYKINYQDINILYNKNGKPYIENSNIYYNISHSYDYVTLIVSNRKCGIDIEKIREINPNIIKTFATIKEQNYILDNPNRLFEIYCLKEAYIKMQGLKLSNIQNIEFTITNKKIICSDNTIKSKLIYHQDYLIAICEKI